MSNSNIRSLELDTFGNFPVYQSRYANLGIEFVYPETFEEDFETASDYYEAIVKCATSGQTYLNNFSVNLGELYLDYGNGYSVDISDIEQELSGESSIEEDAFNICEALTANFVVFSNGIGEAITAINAIKAYIEENMEQYGNMLVNGNLIINSQEELAEVMRGAGLLNGIDLKTLNSLIAEGKSILTYYIENRLAETLGTALADSGIVDSSIDLTEIDALVFGITKLLSVSLKKASTYLVGKGLTSALDETAGIVTQIGEEYVSSLSSILATTCGAAAGALLAGFATYCLDTMVLHEEWTTEDQIEQAARIVTSTLTSCFAGVAGGPVGLCVVAANVIVGKLIDYAYHHEVDSVPYTFEEYSISDHLTTEFENVVINGEACAPEIAICYLKADGFTEEEATAIIACTGSNNLYGSLILKQDDSGTVIIDDQYKVEVEAYLIYKESPNSSENDEYYYNLLTTSEGYTPDEAQAVIDTTHEYRDYFQTHSIENFEKTGNYGVVDSTFSKSSNDLYEESIERSSN